MGDTPFDLGDVLLNELEAVRDRRALIEKGVEPTPAGPAFVRPFTEAEKLQRHRELAHEMGDVSALCLSGGGIRSAAFALGVAQGLARKGVLNKFDYLSTVSGGGYLGSFLTAWAHRDGYGPVVTELAQGSAFGTSFSPLQHLRRYTSYLTPRSAPLSTDMLTVVALFTRNLMLNWLILIPVLALAVWGVKTAVVVLWWLPTSNAVVAFLAAIALAFIGVALLDSLQQRPGWADEFSDRRRFVRWEMSSMLAGGSAACLAGLKYYEYSEQASVGFGAINPVLGIALIAAGLYALAAVFALIFSRPTRRRSTDKTIRTIRPWLGVLVFAVFVVSGAVVGLALAYSMDLVAAARALGTDWRAFLLICLGPPILIASFFFGELVYIGFASKAPWGDAEREWLARAAGSHGRAALCWVVAIGLVFGGSWAVFFLTSQWGKVALVPPAATGGVAGVITALYGYASKTAATVKEHKEMIQKMRSLPSRLLLAAAATVFIVIAVSFLSAGIDAYAFHRFLWLTVSDELDLNPKELDAEFWGRMVGVALVLLLIAVPASLFVNSNRFSLHGVYRNRLMRAFLGASNRKRKANAFTDFDENDNIELGRIWPNKRAPDEGTPPQLHVINMALNIVATRELAWQERKAISFTATPLSVGCGCLEPSALLAEQRFSQRRAPAADARDLSTIRGYFRRADDAGYGMSLGTAMTISGAAASPNMGYHSSPALSVLLTFFNVRLGAWLGNPGPAGAHTYRYSGPEWAAWPLINEALGQTTDEKAYVYLSDGGHFENLGLYEMIRRRCRLIFVSDAGCDPDCDFADLGNAVRKISIDLNVAIEFRTLEIEKRKDPPQKGHYWAIADIRYPECRDKPGLLIYLKPGYQGTEPASVRSYGARNRDFPHEPTADQWFNESQFEAYRALGAHIVKSLDGGKDTTYDKISDYFTAAIATLAPATREFTGFDI